MTQFDIFIIISKGFIFRRNWFTHNFIFFPFSLPWVMSIVQDVAFALHFVAFTECSLPFKMYHVSLKYQKL